MKKILIITLIITSIFLVSCKKKKPTVPSTTYVDLLNREVDVPNEINKVVTLNGAIRLYTYLQDTSKIVLSTKENELAPYYMYAKLTLKEDIFKEYENYTSLDLFKDIKEKDADVVIALDIDKYTADTIELRSGCKVIVLSSGSSECLNNDLINSLKLLGKIIGVNTEEVIEKFKRVENSLQELSKNLNSTYLSYYGCAFNKGIKGLASTVDNSFLKLVNVNEVKLETLSMDAVIKANPNIIFIDHTGYNKLIDEFKDSTYSQSLHNIDAFKNNSVYKIISHKEYGLDLVMLYINAYFALTIYNDTLDTPLNIPSLSSFSATILSDIYNDQITFQPGDNYKAIPNSQFPLSSGTGWLPWI